MPHIKIAGRNWSARRIIRNNDVAPYFVSLLNHRENSLFSSPTTEFLIFLHEILIDAVK